MLGWTNRFWTIVITIIIAITDYSFCAFMYGSVKIILLAVGSIVML